MTTGGSRRRACRAAVLSGAAVVAVLWLRAAVGAGAADYAAGVVTGAAAVVAALLAPVERWARRAGAAMRATVNRPVPRRPRPARTPIHDTAVQAQKGA